MIECRKELMISPFSPENPTLRSAHFLAPSLSSNSKGIPEFPPPSLPCSPPLFNPREWRLRVRFNGWMDPPNGWKEWADRMASFHSSTWKKAGIYEAIFNSIYEFHRNKDLLLSVAEKWCPDTNSFIFSWGEATITLEDMLIAGYSVLGSPVFEPIEEEELKRTQQKLALARTEFVRSPSQKPLFRQWLQKFKNSGSEIEHEAFLSLWLSRFVLPVTTNYIRESCFPIAVHLARGSRIALAPTVLASLYRDLTLLKKSIVASTTSADSDGKLDVKIFSPFQLVLVWVWERFVKLSPKPNLIRNGESRLARWNMVKSNTKDIRLVLDSSRGSFNWRPYTIPLENWDMPKFYKEKEMWVSVNSDLDEALLSFIQCLRVSDLVGLDCIVQYLPHRVARQFGFDQDLPGCVAESKTSADDAWSCYIRSATDAKCYVPSCLFEGHVTKQYLDWWNGLGFEDKLNSNKADQRSGEKTSQKFINLRQMITENLKKKKAVDVKKELRVSAASYGANLTNIRFSLESSKSPPPVETKKSGEVLGAPGYYVKQSETLANTSKIKIADMAEINILWVPPGFLPKCDTHLSGNVGVDADCTTPRISSESSERPPQISKRKNSIETSVIRVDHVKRSKTTPNSSIIKDQGMNKSFTTSVELNNLLVPSGFPPKCDGVEVGDSSAEDNVTIAEVLKLKRKQDVSNNSQKSFSSKADRSLHMVDHLATKHVWEAIQEKASKPIAEILKHDENHSSPVAEKASFFAAKVKGMLKAEDDQNPVCSQLHSQSCLFAGNEFLRVLDEVASVEAAENSSVQSSVAVNETSKDSRLQEVTMAENIMVKESREEKEDVESANVCVPAGSLADREIDSMNGNGEGRSKFLVEEAVLGLEERIRRLEKIVAASKALLESKGLGI